MIINNLLKKQFFILVVASLFVSCSQSLYNQYSMSLSSVESPIDAKVRWGDTKIIETNTNGTPLYQYEDDYIKIIWSSTSTRFNFDLLNKTPFTIKINWDEMAYVDETGTAQRVMHAGTKYADRNMHQPHTVIPKNTSIVDVVLPTDKIYLDHTPTVLLGMPAEWKSRPILPQFSSLKELMDSGILGKKVRILFPIIIQDVQNEYIFEFQIDTAKMINEQ